MAWILNGSYDYEYDESDYYEYEEVFESQEEEDGEVYNYKTKIKPI